VMDVEFLARNWWALAFRGVAAIIFGLLLFLLSGATLVGLVWLFGVYALVEGVFNVVAAVRGRARGDGLPWWALLFEGVVSIAAGIVTFRLPDLTALALLYMIAAWAVVTGIFEMIAAARLRRSMKGEPWLELSGVLSMILGVLTMLVPGVGAPALMLWIGAYAIVFGALLLGLAILLRDGREAEAPLVAQAARA
jgi:uncharacterized membrane protein HdeD (DUF308 family)